MGDSLKVHNAVSTDLTLRYPLPNQVEGIGRWPGRGWLSDHGMQRRESGAVMVASMLHLDQGRLFLTAKPPLSGRVSRRGNPDQDSDIECSLPIC